jgi:hypothetical protein
MTFEKGWINRQFARLERDSENWPDWMRREADLRAAAGQSAWSEDGCPPEHGAREPKVAKAQGS